MKRKSILPNLFSSPKKKAQIQLTFHWIYILIAGALILLFFIGIVVKGKGMAEEKLGQDIVRILDSILTGAGVSENTKNFVDVSGLANYVLEFKCEEGYTGFGIKGGVFKELKVQPFFAPEEIKTTGLILWSLPYEMPYKIMDLLIITSVNTKYVLIGDGGDFREEFLNATGGFNREEVSNLEEIKPGKNYHIRIIDLDGRYIQDGAALPLNLERLDDKKVSALSLAGGATYFKKEGRNWKKKSGQIPLVSLGGEKDAAKYGAIFAGDAESYQCNMKKVFKRMELINEVYDSKLKELEEYYTLVGVPNKERCQLILVEQENDVKTAFNALKGAVPSCKLDYGFCADMISLAENLKELNKELHLNCLALY